MKKLNTNLKSEFSTDSMSDPNFKLSSKEIEKLCISGGMAPSGGNTQPWKLIIEKNIIFIKLDPTRSESFLDIEHYASFFGVGCFLENIIIEADALGLLYKIELKEFSTIVNPIVVIKFHARGKNRNPSKLHQYLEKRITNRHIYNGEIIDDQKLWKLESIFKSNPKFSLSMTSDHDNKEKIATNLGFADAVRFLNDSAYSEMIGEFRWSDKEVERTRDGLDMKTLELPKNAGKLYKLLKDFPFLRSILPEKALSEMAKPLLTGCSHTCAISTSSGLNSTIMINAGRIFERLWLTSTMLGISLQPWSILPFFLIRLNLFGGTGFSSKEKKTIKNIQNNLSTLFSYPSGNNLLFIFRLSLTEKHPSSHSLRIPWQKFTTVLD